MSLQDDRFRFIQRGDRFTWKHRNETELSDVDCTDMTDAQFERLAESVRCNKCNGYGFVFQKQCPRCLGSGFARAKGVAE